jgi:6-phosphogluconolactonase
MIIVVMGVAGAGKTTIGTLLGDALQCEYVEGDSLHPTANIEAMSEGVPLTDTDRIPWLAAIHSRLLDARNRGQDLVVGCSALTESYREVLSDGLSVIWVYLKGPEDLIRSRLENRTGHFLKGDMLASQVEVLEEPDNAIVADISSSPPEIVERILADLRQKPTMRVAPDLNELSLRVAEAVAGTIADVVTAQGRCSLVLSGGSTPRMLHRLLAIRHREQIPWERVHVFWSDERYVSPDDERSNYRMAKETLLDHVPCPPANIHPMPTHHTDPATAAREHEETLRGYFPGEWPRFDLAILGLGPDGHTASLFPGSQSIQERERWVLAVIGPADPPSRLTLTLPVLTRSAHTYFLVTGADKAAEVRRALTGPVDPSSTPAARIQLAEGQVVWWLDRDAAALAADLRSAAQSE